MALAGLAHIITITIIGGAPPLAGTTIAMEAATHGVITAITVNLILLGAIVDQPGETVITIQVELHGVTTITIMVVGLPGETITILSTEVTLHGAIADQPIAGTITTMATTIAEEVTPGVATTIAISTMVSPLGVTISIDLIPPGAILAITLGVTTTTTKTIHQAVHGGILVTITKEVTQMVALNGI